MIQGLYHTLDDLNYSRAVALDHVRMAQDPQASHDAALRAKEIERTIATIKAQIDDDLIMLELLENLIEQLQQSGIKSAHRTLALRHLEDAYSRILRELGDQPAPVINLLP